MKLLAVQANYCTDKAISYTCLSLMDKMGPGVEKEYWGYRFAREAARDYTRNGISRPVYSLLTKGGLPEAFLHRLLDSKVLGHISTGSIVWVWPPASSRFYEGIAVRGAFSVSERVNTCARMYRRKVTEAYLDLKWPVPTALTSDDDAIRRETNLMNLSDAVFAPNGFVKESLLEIGFPEERILETSYGWCPLRMARVESAMTNRRTRPRFIFVGTGCVRKGLPHLLNAWRDAAVDGELVIAGRIDREVAVGCARELSRPDVVVAGHVDQIAHLYQSADVFVFPTHEEGGPQVTFEAAGCGLALLVSEMGAAGAFRPGTDAIVVKAMDHDGWVESIRALATNVSLLDRMKAASLSRAQDFTWEKVADRRLQQLRSLFNSGSGSSQ